MKIKTETRKVNVELKLWNSFNRKWSVDVFNDLEVLFPNGKEVDEETGYIVATDDELDYLLLWWDNECDRANRELTQIFLEHCDTNEWSLFVTDID